MGTSDQPGRSKLLLWLAGFVVVFAAVSWFVTGGIRFQAAPLPLPTTIRPPSHHREAHQLSIARLTN
jgi:hypothetical protein